MLLEWLEYRLTPCARAWRDLGYLREQIAIDARLRRQRAAWEPHLEATRVAVREAVRAANGGGRGRCVLVLGAGLAHDLPLDVLARGFSTVVLADLVHRPLAAWRARRGRPGVRCVSFDATGVLRRWHKAGPRLEEGRLLADLAETDPGLPEECGGEPELVVSANLASQLMLLPADWFEAAGGGRGPGFRERLEAAGAAAHLRWLRRRTGTTLLVSDVRRVWRDRSGRPVESEEVGGLGSLPGPWRRWTWRVAPIPEHDPERHLEHEVGAWLTEARRL